MMDQHHEKRNLTPLKRALEKGGFGQTNAYELICEGKIIAYKMEGRTMVDLNSIEAYHLTLLRIEPGSNKLARR
jgi:hypothetical protein